MTTNLYDLPKEMLVKMVTTIQEKAIKNCEEEVFLLKEELRIVRAVTNYTLYRCGHGNCNAMWAYNVNGENSYSGCKEFNFCNCVDGMSLCYCDKHTCEDCDF